LTNVDTFYQRMGEVGYSTNGYLVIKDLIDRRKVVDKVMIFTDCQLWDSNTNHRHTGNSISHLWDQYRKMAPGATLCLFDLAGYGTSPLRVEDNGVYLVSGWSEKVFDILKAIENGSNAIREIQEGQ
jgi:60 kDa SS-A/Ro ribonucleoprotein